MAGQTPGHSAASNLGRNFAALASTEPIARDATQIFKPDHLVSRIKGA